MAAIDNLVIFLYLAALIAIGLYANYKQNDVDDYYVAGRRQGSFSIACLWLAGWIGGASIIGSSGKAYEAGITGVWYVGSLALGCLLYGVAFAARNARAARRGALLAVALMLPIGLAAAWLGMTTAVLFPGIENSDDALTTFVVMLFPAGLKGLMLIGILAAIMSSADICILTASANVTRDVYQRYIDPGITQQRMMRLGMLASLGVGVLSALLAWKMQDVLDILLLAFTLNSAALILPTIAAVYAWRVDAATAFWSVCLSLVTVLGWYLAAAFELAPVFAIEPLWPGLVVAFFSFFTLRALTPRPAATAEAPA